MHWFFTINTKHLPAYRYFNSRAVKTWYADVFGFIYLQRMESINTIEVHYKSNRWRHQFIYTGLVAIPTYDQRVEVTVPGVEA